MLGKPNTDIIVSALNCNFIINISTATLARDVTDEMITKMQNNASTSLKPRSLYKKFQLHCNNTPLSPKERVFPLHARGKIFTFCIQDTIKVQISKGNKRNAFKLSKVKQSLPSSSSLKMASKSRCSAVVARKVVSDQSVYENRKQNQREQAIIAQINALKLELSEMGSLYTPNIEDYSNVRIIERIGSGSCGNVYSCYVNGWACAMKVVPMSKAEILGNGSSISQEIQVLEQLPSHPNVVQYLYHQQEEDQFKIFLKKYEYSLDAEIQQRRETNEHFTLKHILCVLKNVVDGLLSLHSHNIIHRDIKSHNIFVQKENSRKTYVIGDLDSAKILSKRNAALTVVGTPAFMAPEVLQADGEIEYTFSADVFSFGMLIFELLTLELPYADCRTFQVAGKIINGEPPKFPAAIDSRFEPLVKLHLDCIHNSPESRPTMSQIFARLATMKKFSRNSARYTQSSPITK